MQSNQIVNSVRDSVISSLILGTGLFLSSPTLFAQSNANTSPIRSAQSSDQAQLKLVTVAAKRDFAQFVQHNVLTRSGSLPNEFPLDITDVQDLKDAAITYGFQVYTIAPKDVVAGRGDLSSMVKPTGIWRFVISHNGRPIGLATVEQIAGKWETVAYGAATLSKDIDAMMGFHGNADRSNVRFIRIYQAQSDFLEVVSARDSKARFAPLHSARESLLLQQRITKSTTGASIANDGLIEPADFLEPLRAAVKANLSAFR